MSKSAMEDIGDKEATIYTENKQYSNALLQYNQQLL